MKFLVSFLFSLLICMTAFSQGKIKVSTLQVTDSTQLPNGIWFKDLDRISSISDVATLRNLKGFVKARVQLSGYYQQGDCPPFTVTWLSKSAAQAIKSNVADDKVIWFYANGDNTGNSGYWHRDNLQNIDIRQTGAKGDLQLINIAKTKTVAIGDGTTRGFSFATQTRIKAGTYHILYTRSDNNQLDSLIDNDYGDETGLLRPASGWTLGVNQPSGIVYYATGRVEGAELGKWGQWMDSLKKLSTAGDTTATAKINTLLAKYDSVQPVIYTDVLLAALNVKPSEAVQFPDLSTTRYYPANPIAVPNASPYGDTMFAGAKIIFPVAPKNSTPIIVSYTNITYSGTFYLQDGTTNTTRIQTALDNVQELDIPSEQELKRTTGHGGIGFYSGTNFIPAGRIVRGTGKKSSAILQYYYDTLNPYHLKWLAAAVNATDNSLVSVSGNKGGELRFIQPRIHTNSTDVTSGNYNDPTYGFNLAATSWNGYIFENKSVGDTAGGQQFIGLRLRGVGETLGAVYWDCYWDMDRRYQGITKWHGYDAQGNISEPLRVSQHNIQMIEVPNVTIQDCESNWALEDGFYVSSFTGWQDPTTAPNYVSVTKSLNAVNAITISNSQFDYNGRNGTFITSGKNITVDNNVYNYDQFAVLFDRSGVPQNYPSGALAFEEHNDSQYLNHLIVTNNKVFNSFCQAGHYLGKGYGIDNAVHRNNFYGWDYADWYANQGLVQEAVKFSTRTRLLTDANNIIRNPPNIGFSIQLSSAAPEKCDGNTYSGDYIINAGNHPFEIKHSPNLSIEGLKSMGSGWRFGIDITDVAAPVYILGASTGIVGRIDTKVWRGSPLINNPVKMGAATDGFTPYITQGAFADMIDTSRWDIPKLMVTQPILPDAYTELGDTINLGKGGLILLSPSNKTFTATRNGVEGGIYVIKTLRVNDTLANNGNIVLESGENTNLQMNKYYIFYYTNGVLYEGSRTAKTGTYLNIFTNLSSGTNIDLSKGEYLNLNVASNTWITASGGKEGMVYYIKTTRADQILSNSSTIVLNAQENFTLRANNVYMFYYSGGVLYEIGITRRQNQDILEYNGKATVSTPGTALNVDLNGKSLLKFNVSSTTTVATIIDNLRPLSTTSQREVVIYSTNNNVTLTYSTAANGIRTNTSTDVTLVANRPYTLVYSDGGYWILAVSQAPLSLTTNNSSGAATLDPITNILNIPQYTPASSYSYLGGNPNASVVAQTGTVKYYSGFSGGGALTTSNGARKTPIGRAATLSDFVVILTGTQPSDGTLTLSVRKNGAATGIIITIPAGTVSSNTKYSDNTHTITVSANDDIDLELTNGSTTAPSSTIIGYSIAIH